MCGSVGTETAWFVCRSDGTSGAQDLHRRLCGCSLPPSHFRPQEASLYCPVPPTSGAAQAMEGCIVGVQEGTST